MSRFESFEIDICGDGGEWVPIEASSAEDAAEAYTREHAEDEGWSNDVTMSVRDGAGVVHVVYVRWHVEMVVDARTVRRVKP